MIKEIERSLAELRQALQEKQNQTDSLGVQLNNARQQVAGLEQQVNQAGLGLLLLKSKIEVLEELLENGNDIPAQD